MAGTIEGVYSCLIVMVGMVFAWAKTGEPAFGAVIVVGIITLGAHAAIARRNKREAQSDKTWDV